MLSQVNSNQKGENNFCIFLTRLIALTRVLRVTVREGRPVTCSAGFGFVPQKHRRTAGGTTPVGFKLVSATLPPLEGG